MPPFSLFTCIAFHSCAISRANPDTVVCSTDSSSFQSFELYIAAGDSFASSKAVAAMLITKLEASKQEGGAAQLVDDEVGFDRFAAQMFICSREQRGDEAGLEQIRGPKSSPFSLTRVCHPQWLNEVWGVAKVAAANHTSSLVLQTRAMLKIKGGDTKKLKSPSGTVAGGPRRPFAYPCDDPVVKANSGLCFDYEVSPLFPEVLPTV